MQGLRRRCANDLVHLDLSPSTSPANAAVVPSTSSSGLSIDESESAETRIRRLIEEHPVIIFSRSSCCMCHVMKKLLLAVGVHPTVIELDDHEMAALPPPNSDDSSSTSTSSYNSNTTASAAASNTVPAVFIGGNSVGGLESLVALHLSGHLVPKLVEVGALWV